MRKKLIMCFLLVLVLMMTSMSFAGDKAYFSDVDEVDWYYNAVKRLTEYGVIGGYGDGTFRPYGNVKRSEYSKLLVAGLNLDLNESISSIFVDVSNSYWAKPYIMTAKNYLTAYDTGTGIEFRPELNAEREDLTVALVKALGYGDETYSESTLDRFEDRDQISQNLMKYVAIAVEKDLIGGSENNGKLYFKPRNEITRAETAQLLLNVIDAEKIVFDDLKVVLGDDGYAPVVTGYTKTDGTVKLNWTKTDVQGFEFYKVVYSPTNPNPVYPSDSYLYYFDDVNTLEAYVNQLPEGKYYFSVTSVINGKSYAGNSVYLSTYGYEDVDYVVPNVTAYEVENGIVINWDEISHSKLKGYKVILSKHNSTPAYPSEGYAYYITDLSKTSATISMNQKYYGGDFGTYVVPGDYYASITAVYSDKKISGNAVRSTMTGETTEENEKSYIFPNLTVTEVGDKLLLSWDKITHPEFNGYKVVASVSNPKPKYSEDGYMKWITNADTTTWYIKDGDGYNGGDFVAFEKGHSYYFSITAVYDGGKIPGNTIYMQIP